MIGGASFINMLLGMLKTKAVALLLGADGVALLGIFGQIQGLAGSISGLGLSSSGVRQIADAEASGDEEKIARVIRALRSIVLVTGLVGGLGLIVLSPWLSKFSFGTGLYTGAIALLGISVFFINVSAGQVCLIQGMRMIKKLALVNILGAFFGLILALPCYYFWRIDGIILSLLLGALATLLTSWYFVRPIKIRDVKLKKSDFWNEWKTMLKLGACFMIAGVSSGVASYLVKVLLIRKIGIDGCGYYQAAFMLSGVLITFILNAMSADYYPRLVGQIAKPAELRQSVNDQAETALLLAFPCLLGMMAFASVAIYLFYSSEFTVSVFLLQLFLFGILGKIICWPPGFVILAHGHGTVFVLFEVIFAVIHIAGVFLLLPVLGIIGAAIAFVIMYLVADLIILSYVYWRYNVTLSYKIFMWAAATAVIMLLMLGLDHGVTNLWINWGCKIFLLGAVSLVSLHQLCHRLNFTPAELRDRLQKRFRG